MKRQCKEWFRLHRHTVAVPHDIWISIKRRFTREEAPQVEAMFLQALHKMNPR